MTRVFALIVGIDNYKSGYTWNLQSSTTDAKQIRNWLMKDLHVPSDHISLLLDRHATRANVEAELIKHFMQNPDIRPGDAMLFYFAGHGSSMVAPAGWFDEERREEDGDDVAHVLCTYDHDTQRKDGTGGRVVGITDRALLSFMDDLATKKGNNITIMLDTCFDADLHSRKKFSHLSHTRWTRTVKARAADLYGDGAEFELSEAVMRRNSAGFVQPGLEYTVVTAAHPGERAAESKVGGRFTTAFLAAVKQGRSSLDVSWDTLLESVAEETGEQHVYFSGPSRESALFGETRIHLRKSISRGSIHERVLKGSAKVRRSSLARVKNVWAGRPSFHRRSRSESPESPESS